MERKSRTLSF